MKKRTESPLQTVVKNGKMGINTRNSDTNTFSDTP